MLKRFTVLAVFALFTLTATSLFSQDKSSMTASTDKVISVKPDNFQDVAADMLGKEVEIQGMVVHVCKHGGKKMFLVGENPDMRVKITASDKVSVFDPELEGSIVNVTGIVEPMDDAESVAAEAASEGNQEDADHKSYYHKPQFSISCSKMKEIKD
jgi:RecJ-like exonuclease